MVMRALIAGNWKMNGLANSAAELDQIAAELGQLRASARADALICPPATLIFGFAERARSAAENGAPLAIGAQDCHFAERGAHTGDLSAEMVADAGATMVIVGHSERRADHGERDDLVRSKAAAALRAGLSAIVCVGEHEAERDAGQAEDVVLRQIAESLPDIAADEAPKSIAVAYEPVWAIGTGRTPTPSDIEAMHGKMREAMTARFGSAGAQIRLLYGGSVKPANAAEILTLRDVNGALVGGASLKAADFMAIYRAAIGT